MLDPTDRSETDATVVASSDEGHLSRAHQTGGDRSPLGDEQVYDGWVRSLARGMGESLR